MRNYFTLMIFNVIQTVGVRVCVPVCVHLYVCCVCIGVCVFLCVFALVIDSNDIRACVYMCVCVWCVCMCVCVLCAYVLGCTSVYVSVCVCNYVHACPVYDTQSCLIPRPDLAWTTSTTLHPPRRTRSRPPMRPRDKATPVEDFRTTTHSTPWLLLLSD